MVLHNIDITIVKKLFWTTFTVRWVLEMRYFIYTFYLLCVIAEWIRISLFSASIGNLEIRNQKHLPLFFFPFPYISQSFFIWFNLRRQIFCLQNIKADRLLFSFFCFSSNVSYRMCITTKKDMIISIQRYFTFSFFSSNIWINTIKSIISSK